MKFVLKKLWHSLYGNAIFLGNDVESNTSTSDSSLSSETDLTSLSWLHNISNFMSINKIDDTTPISPTPQTHVSPPIRKLPTKVSNHDRPNVTINIDTYKQNGDKKPPFSYATLICMALCKNQNKMTLSEIYQWISENFLFYRNQDKSWQVSFLFFVISSFVIKCSCLGFSLFWKRKFIQRFYWKVFIEGLESREQE